MHVLAHQSHNAVLYCVCRGTANNAAVQRLLHFAVSDVSDDVRRAAVLCLGFVLMKAPEQCPKIVGLLAESFNPHVRYGAAMAVGLACAGTLICSTVVWSLQGVAHLQWFRLVACSLYLSTYFDHSVQCW